MQVLSPEKIDELKSLVKELEERDITLARLSKKIDYLRNHNKERIEAYSKILYFAAMAQDQDRIATQDSTSGEPELPQLS